MDNELIRVYLNVRESLEKKYGSKRLSRVLILLEWPKVSRHLLPSEDKQALNTLKTLSLNRTYFARTTSRIVPEPQPSQSQLIIKLETYKLKVENELLKIQKQLAYLTELAEAQKASLAALNLRLSQSNVSGPKKDDK